MMKKLYQLIFAVTVTLFSSASFADECDSVGYLLENGQYNSAALIVDPLLKKGVSCAQFYKGIMYLRGYEVTKDSQQGIALIKAAADKGYTKAIEFLDAYY